MVAECLSPNKAELAEELAKQRVLVDMQLAECKWEGCSTIADIKASWAEMVASEMKAALANWLSLHRP